jgi:DNA-binding NtrC family response regulator
MQFYLIDDDAVIFMLINRNLLKQSFFPTPIMFEQAEAAFNHLRENYDADEEYLVMLDINMPGMNGWEFLDALPQLASPSNVYVAICSSSINERDFIKAEGNPYVIKYLVKPLNLESLQELEALILEKRAQQA